MFIADLPTIAECSIVWWAIDSSEFSIRIWLHTLSYVYETSLVFSYFYENLTNLLLLLFILGNLGKSSILFVWFPLSGFRDFSSFLFRNHYRHDLLPSMCRGKLITFYCILMRELLLHFVEFCWRLLHFHHTLVAFLSHFFVANWPHFGRIWFHCFDFIDLIWLLWFLRITIGGGVLLSSVDQALYTLLLMLYSITHRRW